MKATQILICSIIACAAYGFVLMIWCRRSLTDLSRMHKAKCERDRRDRQRQIDSHIRSRMGKPGCGAPSLFINRLSSVSAITVDGAGTKNRESAEMHVGGGG